MTTAKKFTLFSLLTLGTVVMAGCSCVKNDCAPPPPPRPRPAPVVCDPCGPIAVAPAPAPVCNTGVCQIVPPGTTLYSDPPTVTLSATGEVINRTPVTFYPANAAVTTYSPNPQATTVSTYSVPRSSNVRPI